MSKKAIILGNDHTNSIGLIHSLGRCGIYTIVVVWGRKTGMVPSSRFVSEFYHAASPEACMDLIIDKFGNSSDIFVIIPGSDGAAVVLEDYKKKLSSNFFSQYVEGDYTLRDLDNKSLQVKLAKKAGFNVPESWIITSIDNIPDGITYPCIIKSLVAMEGSKSDLMVCETPNELKSNLGIVLTHTSKVQVQQYIIKDYDYDVMGCRFSDGDVYIPLCLKKHGIYPPNVGLATVSESLPVIEEIKVAATHYLQDVNYYGIFDFEFMHSTLDDENYFIECNLRNSGSNAFALRAGYNIPLYHFKDLVSELKNKDINRKQVKPMFYLRELNHWMSYRSHQISLCQYIRNVLRSSGNLTWYWNDMAPFFKEIMPIVKGILRIKETTKYYN